MAGILGSHALSLVVRATEDGGLESGSVDGDRSTRSEAGNEVAALDAGARAGARDAAKSRGGCLFAFLPSPSTSFADPMAAVYSRINAVRPRPVSGSGPLALVRLSILTSLPQSDHINFVAVNSSDAEPEMVRDIHEVVQIPSNLTSLSCRP